MLKYCVIQIVIGDYPFHDMKGIGDYAPLDRCGQRGLK